MSKHGRSWHAHSMPIYRSSFPPRPVELPTVVQLAAEAVGHAWATRRSQDILNISYVVGLGVTSMNKQRPRASSPKKVDIPPCSSKSHCRTDLFSGHSTSVPLQTTAPTGTPRFAPAETGRAWCIGLQLGIVHLGDLRRVHRERRGGSAGVSHGFTLVSTSTPVGPEKSENRATYSFTLSVRACRAENTCWVCPRMPRH